MDGSAIRIPDAGSPHAPKGLERCNRARLPSDRFCYESPDDCGGQFAVYNRVVSATDGSSVGGPVQSCHRSSAGEDERIDELSAELE